MNKQEIYDFLKNKDIWYEITEHKAVFKMDELNGIYLPYKEYNAKNLFVRDDKKRNYYLITVKGNKRVDLKDFRKSISDRCDKIYDKWNKEYFDILDELPVFFQIGLTGVFGLLLFVIFFKLLQLIKII